MRTTIDQAGRLVVPKALRDRVGLTPGDVEITVSGNSLTIQPIATHELIEDDGVLTLPPSNTESSTDDIRGLRLDAQR